MTSMRPALRDLVRFDRSRITSLRALQNALGVFIPLACGAATGHVLVGLAAGIGALNVCFSDRPGPYRLRAGRMLLVSVVGALSALVGGVFGSIGWLTVVLVALWGLAGGMLVVYGPAAEQIGLTSIILLLVYGGFGLTPRDAVLQAGFILLGGLFQTALSVVAWPLRQFGPERQALSAVFRRLAAYTRAPSSPDATPPLTAELTAAGTTLVGLGRAHGEPADVYRILLDEAERVRLELVALHHLRTDLLGEQGETAIRGRYEAMWAPIGELLDSLGAAAAAGTTTAGGDDLLRRLEGELERMRRDVEGIPDPVTAEILRHADALLGQLRACVDILNGGARPQSDRSLPVPPQMATSDRVQDVLSTLRANLTLRSASFRHALRMAVTLVIATVLARQFGLTRSYWVPLTVAIVLKPDFTSTFTRGVLRIAGTLAGLGLATLVVYLVAGNLVVCIVLIGVFTFLIRSVGPANFGVSAVLVTAMVVVLISLVGARPESVIHYRGMDTLIGGALSLAAYAVWPTWERVTTPGVLASMLDAYRRYVQAVMRGYLGDRVPAPGELEGIRLEARLARSNAEASAQRMRSEPAADVYLGAAEGLLASSHRFVHSAMMLEASLYAPARPSVPDGLERFARNVETTLAELSQALRGEPAALDRLPDVRADQNALIASGLRHDPLVLETERMTNSLNTMTGLVERMRPRVLCTYSRSERRARHTA